MVEMRQRAIDMVREEGATGAARLPAGSQHEMIDDQLMTSVEQVGEGLAAFRRVENIVLVQLDPWESLPRGAYLVAQPSFFFFLLHQRLAGGQPFFAGNDGMLHGTSWSRDQT